MIKKRNLLKELEMCIKTSIVHDSRGYPKLAIKENKKAILLIEKIKKLLEGNDAIFEMHCFLIGTSNITRKPK